jgi:hypothetical protein
VTFSSETVAPPPPGASAAAWGLARRTRPDCDPSRSVLAWPLRHRPLLDGAGYVPLRREFEQGFLDGHGPAQVGLGPPFGGPHRLRLSQQHLRLTQAAGPALETSTRETREAGPVSLAALGEAVALFAWVFRLLAGMHGVPPGHRPVWRPLNSIPEISCACYIPGEPAHQIHGSGGCALQSERL